MAYPQESYSGAPASPSPEFGEKFLDVLGGKAAEAVTQLLDGAIGSEDCHSPIWKIHFLFLNPMMIRLTNRLIGFKHPLS